MLHNNKYLHQKDRKKDNTNKKKKAFCIHVLMVSKREEYAILLA
jgi:hypothetical protein